MVPFYGWDSTASRLQGHYGEIVDFSSLRSQKFLVLIWLTQEKWNDKSTSELPSGFELEPPGLGIQRLNY